MAALHLPRTSDVTEEVALALLAGVSTAAASRGVRLAACVVDRGGNLVAVRRADGSQIGGVTLAIDKAYTAVAFGAPTARWAESSVPGGTDWGMAGSLGGRAVMIAGGVPLYAAGELIGGLGVSGAPSSIDDACARESVAALGLEVEP
ncbi:uncharacterized protein GlcG (DUF336 family) [Microbacterium sp. SLBN-154]|uniref:GlcG/HbpS family heme-binding protein n=1 Tax=Microbacterium sp. SLBN-154 TaxID=2768458 RepID=UPI0011541A73|nr:heme-binding protein [Microbacterium sp. SLBN-154]TQK17634.1 uncharacterized protein GlcG (DUF336 family) [Microbacterium sp. SLBN-154]